MIKIVKGILQSGIMQREIPYRVVLSENFDNSKKKFPVLYLLHGLFGSCDNWLELTDLKTYAVDKNLIIVLPEGENGWYTNSATIEEDKFESYFTEELIPEIDLLNRTDGTKEKRAVVGLSMGGYGALKFALKKADLFAFAGSISGAFDAPNQTENNPGVDWENLGPSILKAFGGENSQTRFENDLFEIIRQISAENIARLPYFYVNCGIEDDFLEVNRNLARLLKQKMISYEYHEIPGGHNWNYWNKEIKHILQIVNTKLHKE